MTRKINSTLEAGTYEIIRNRLAAQTAELRSKLDLLNTARKEVFGNVETGLIANDRINTPNYCIAQDICSIGTLCIFGYNVHVGLRSGITLPDVFSVYNFENNAFKECDLSLIQNEKFEQDFQNLYRYYKQAFFSGFVTKGNYLYMVFQISKTNHDFKVFKWLKKETELVYVDARSEHEVKPPRQFEFRWERLQRDAHRPGNHPHVSVLDRVFVETVGGDLTIKVEDNTDDGQGIYREPIDNPDQTLDDAEYFYADLGHLIVLKIKPYQEAFRYFVFNEKMQTVKRIDALDASGILLPDQHGLIFSNGYYLQTGDFKMFDAGLQNMAFRKRIVSPNGEDFLYVFQDIDKGASVLLHYNIIEQKVNSPILCNGFTLFPDGELCYFKTENEPCKHHVVQIWQTPFITGTVLPSDQKDSFLYKVGNKDIVKAMAECREIIILAEKEDSYAGLYTDLERKSGDVMDAYFWIGEAETFNLREALQAVKETSGLAIGEFEKKRRIEQNTATEILRVKTTAETLFENARRQTFDQVDLFVESLAELRKLSGEIISLKELRYTDLELVEKLETECQEISALLSNDCIGFLLEEKSLDVYKNKIDASAAKLENIQTAIEGKELESEIDKTGAELELLIEIVSNLKIDDATKSAKIIDHISALYASLNQLKAKVKKKQKSLQGEESVVAFNVQIKLLDQAMINYLDVAVTAEKCDTLLVKLLVQLEGLEAKFAEFDEFILKITEKREEIYTVFENKKNKLIEARNNRTAALQSAAERILTGMKNRLKNIKDIVEINGFFATDLMVEKIRDIVAQLEALEDSNKAAAIRTELKTLQEETIRQLRDEQELFVEGKNIIKLGRHPFSVNVQPLDLTIVREQDNMFFHLTGSDFFQEITDQEFLKTKAFWAQDIVAENDAVYRSEYLAYQLFNKDKNTLLNANGQLENFVQEQAAKRYDEAYTRGVHDKDAAKILKGLLQLSGQIDLLYFLPEERMAAKIFWKMFLEKQAKILLQKQINSASTILQVFPDTHGFDFLLDEIAEKLEEFLNESGLFNNINTERAALYLFRELSRSEHFIISTEAELLLQAFNKHLSNNKFAKAYKESITALQENKIEQFQLIQKWVQAFTEQAGKEIDENYISETATLLFLGDYQKENVIPGKSKLVIDGLTGEHKLVASGTYELDYNRFVTKLSRFEAEDVPQFKVYTKVKKQLAESCKKQLRLEEFKPRVLSSFVRNKLIDQVYLPMIGENLAKQLGTAGANSRTDRMGMLLLISPPGYGKTTLMEYIANRLGLIFMKINGPAIGHKLTSLDPADAPDAAARQELEKLNLSFEMGNNVMLYLDDIQHCNPEFLQKFISLCDGQRKIEGVFNGESKTYDLRGKRFCVIMAGNPYTETGTKFRIPDMLANRADIYNIGDIIGDSADVFSLSYLENALTSNPVLRQLATKSHKDVYTLLKMIENNSREGLDFEANHSPEELNEYVEVLKKMIKIRDVVLKVNQAYIQSAAMEEAYRNEPAFRLQGSYRDMNKLAAKVVPVMNDDELKTLILSHYEGEAQTLTSGAEANFLKLKELLGILNETEDNRWLEIKKVFNKNKVFNKLDVNNPMSGVLAQMVAFTDGVEGIKSVLAEAVNGRTEV